MADYSADIKKYTKSVDEAAVSTIVKYCGIALQKADSSLVSCSDATELERVRDGFAAKKLGLSASAAEAAMQKVCAAMKEDRTKHRVTFYYLLAEHSGTLAKLS